jgi:UDP-GlcNAc:undecaprenyl-phosphate GlcNAc-1-phosphate transferase
LYMARFENIVGCAVGGFAVSFVVIAFMLGAGRRKLVCRCSEFHHSDSVNLPVPRYGGVALAAAFVVFICLACGDLFGFRPNSQFWVISGTALAMFGLGFWDDIRPLGARRKLAGQLLIASVAYLLGLSINHFKVPFVERIIDLGFYSWPITVVWLVAMTNLINLIDGVDGLAGGISLMVMILLSVVGGGVGIVSPLAAAMAGALVAFLRFNFPPAKIYLGDGGAYFLGFLIGGITIFTSEKGTVVAALISPLFVLALPILDTTLTLLRRALNGLPLFRPDQGHLHHRLLQSGFSRRNVTLGAYVFTAYFLGLGMIAFWWRGQYFPLAMGGATMAVLILACRFRFSRKWFNVAAMVGDSLKSRTEINYALAHSRWLAMEGERGRDIQSICEDTAMVARRLGFVSMRIQFENNETVWKMTEGPNPGGCWQQSKGDEDNSLPPVGSGTGCSDVFRHQLPGQPNCFIELESPKAPPNLGNAGTDRCQIPQAVRSQISPTKFGIVSEVLAEGWAKSVKDWHRKNKQPICFKPSAPRKAEPQAFGFSSATATAEVV